MRLTITFVQGGSPTSRSPYHQVCLLAARARQTNDEAVQNHGATERREPAGRGTSSTRDSWLAWERWVFAARTMEEGGGGDDGRLWRRRPGRGGSGAWREEVPAAVLRFGRPCDHAATSSNSSSSLPCPDQFIDRVWTFLLCGRDVYPQCKLCNRPQRLFDKCLADFFVIIQRQVPTV